MRLWTNKSVVAYLFLISTAFSMCVVFAQTTNEAIGLAGTVTGLRYPLGYHDNGQLKAQLKAEKANVQENGQIYATNITSEFFTVEGLLDITMTADDCIYDKQAKMAKSENNVKVDKKGIVITGKGFEWDSNEQMVTILNNVKVVLTGGMMKSNMLKGKRK
ncbi:MAG: hypothetical protein A2283_15610 [Lentisphaerae bacterium RIFOXYA12_FULL_48_11]|nr:MAG: hypothetical protein A2283_15610 [Lentisphaerae bacterium RIFOXYA12_FULL_48_11]